jgi:hypothetical protein
MNTELDYDLSPEQWQALKALRAPVGERRAPGQFVIEQLAALGLAVIDGSGPQITPMGRKVLVRGSSQLWEDVAA